MFRYTRTHICNDLYFVFILEGSQLEEEVAALKQEMSDVRRRQEEMSQTMKRGFNKLLSALDHISSSIETEGIAFKEKSRKLVACMS